MTQSTATRRADAPANLAERVKFPNLDARDRERARSARMTHWRVVSGGVFEEYFIAAARGVGPMRESADGVFLARATSR